MMGTTRPIVPRVNGDSSVGVPEKHWGKSYIDEGHFYRIKLNGGDLGAYLAESTGYGIVSGCEPSISGLTVTVGAGVIHLADGTRKEIVQTNITLDNADPSNPRIDLVYIDSTGTVAKVTGTAAASPSAPSVPANGISVAQVSVAANATVGTLTEDLTVPAIYIPVGVVLPFSGNGDIPDGYLPCNGAAISRATYKALFGVIGTTYGVGDGSTTFNLPNLTDKFIQGSATAGTSKAAGLPNITGTIAGFNNYYFALANTNVGAFFTGSFDAHPQANATGANDSSGAKGVAFVNFDASRSSSIYGNSTTVQPPALTMRYIIKY